MDRLKVSRWVMCYLAGCSNRQVVLCNCFRCSEHRHVTPVA